MKHSARELLDGYHNPEGSAGRKFMSRSFTGNPSHGENIAALKRINAVTSAAKSLFAFTSARFYGLFLLAFGLSTLIINLGKEYLGNYETVALEILVVGVISAIVGIFLVVSDKPLCIFLQDFKVTDYLFFEFFCIRRTSRLDGGRGVPSWVGLVLGTAFAALSAVLPFFAVVSAIAFAVYAFVSFVSPEFSLFSTILVLPYLSLLEGHEAILAALVGVSVLSFVRKVALGKRVYHFEQYDALLGIFLLFILISGIFLKGIESFTDSLVMIVLALGYVLSGSIVANRRLADCLINALIFSSVPVSGIAIVQAVIKLIHAPVYSFSGVSATFKSPEVLSVFLLFAFIFSLYFTNARRRKSAKIAYLIIAVYTFISLFLTLFAWAIAVALFVLVGYILKGRSLAFGVFAVSLALIPQVFLLLPTDALLSLSRLPVVSSLSLEGFVRHLDCSRRILGENIFTGIGIGETSFILELENMGLSELGYINGAAFLVDTAIEAGVFSLITLIVIFAVRVRHSVVYLPYVKNSQLTVLSKFSALSLSAAVALGAFNCLWADKSMFFLFWCIFGVGSAVLRVSKKEYDDRIAYYSDGRSAESSALDIEIG